MKIKFQEELIMSQMIMFYVPCSGKEEAKKIAKVLLKSKLVACANIVGSCTSIYEWEGEIKEEEEAILIMKTVTSLYLDVERTIVEHHSYKCPCIVALNTAEVNMPFFQWVEERTFKK